MSSLLSGKNSADVMCGSKLTSKSRALLGYSVFLLLDHKPNVERGIMPPIVQKRVHAEPVRSMRTVWLCIISWSIMSLINSIYLDSYF